jgi:selenide,water dikinase
LLGEGLAEEIIRGGSAICREAGIPVLGGHSIDDPEPKFGMVAVGEVDPDRIVRLFGALPGDLLVLTKAIGTGVISTALKAGVVDEAVLASAVDSMVTLNSAAAEAMVAHGVRSGTDVTGYGLLGHLRNLVRASGLSAEVTAGAVPLLPGAVTLAQAGHVPGGTTRNLADLAEDIAWAAEISEPVRTLLADSQTSGGLLLAVPPDRVDALKADLRGQGTAAAVIGKLTEGRVGYISVL